MVQNTSAGNRRLPGSDARHRWLALDKEAEDREQATRARARTWRETIGKKLGVWRLGAPGSPLQRQRS